MIDYTVKFKFSSAFKTGRIASKTGECDITGEEVMPNANLIDMITAEMMVKTGRPVISVEILDVIKK